MKMLRNNKHWIGASIAIVSLVVAGVGVAQRQSARSVPHAQSAKELSTVFRHVSRQVLPSIVAIETIGKETQRIGRRSPSGDENSPFGDFFRNDPRFREFFREMPSETPRSRGMGSGFVIDSSGVIMTNSHVVRDAAKVTVRFNDGREYTATDVKVDPRTDVAIVRIESDEPLQALPMGDSAAMEIGDWVLAVGNPFGLDMTVTAGIISGKGRGRRIAEREDFLQTDAAINPGNSGGPLINLNGEAIGINTAIASRSGGSEGIGFTIPMNMARWVAQQLIENGEVKRAYLGVSVQAVDAALSKQFKTPIGQGTIIGRIVSDSPADKAKLQQGDVILNFAGQNVTSPRNLQGIVEKLTTGKAYDMTILRDGEKTKVSVTVNEMPADYSLAGRGKPKIERPSPKDDESDSSKDLGIDVRELTPELSKQLGVEDAEGVVISSVQTNSPADLAGLSAGNIIEKVGSQTVKSLDEFRKAMKDSSSADGVLLLIRTRTGSQFVVIQSKN